MKRARGESCCACGPEEALERDAAGYTAADIAAALGRTLLSAEILSKCVVPALRSAQRLQARVAQTYPGPTPLAVPANPALSGGRT